MTRVTAAGLSALQYYYISVVLGRRAGEALPDRAHACYARYN